jgi:hypothetical protein
MIPRFPHGSQVSAKPPKLGVLAGLVIAAQLCAGADDSNLSRLRMGSAASFFGNATAVADFNGDNHVDFVKVDHGIRSDQFRVEFQIGANAPVFLDFTSRAQSLGVSVLDVDSDNDQDIVLVRPLTREVIAVLVNDGEGGFRHEPTSEYSIPSALDETLHGPAYEQQNAFAWLTRKSGFVVCQSAPSGVVVFESTDYLKRRQSFRLGTQLRTVRSGRAPPHHA